jgi:hypothetical protein
LDDFHLLATTTTRDEFVAQCPHPFLMALSGMEQPAQPARTMRLGNGQQLAAALLAERRRLGSGERSRAVLAIKKTLSTFPGMITVGRAPNNDVVIADALVSKFHAWFRISDGVVALADAGSANGTRVGEASLPPKGDPVPVRPGDKITFGVLAFHFVDAAGLWAALRTPR